MQIVHDFRQLGRPTGDVRAGRKALQAQGIGGLVTNMPFENSMQDPGTWRQFREFLRACRALEMRVWLYDEKGYSSGCASGRKFEDLTEEQRRTARSPAEFLAVNEAIRRLTEQLAPASLVADVFLYYPIEPEGIPS